MKLDNAPIAASYARTLVYQGCPQRLAEAAADILARDRYQQRSADEQEIVAQAWSAITTSSSTQR